MKAAFYLCLPCIPFPLPLTTGSILTFYDGLCAVCEKIGGTLRVKAEAGPMAASLAPTEVFTYEVNLNLPHCIHETNVAYPTWGNCY